MMRNLHAVPDKPADQQRPSQIAPISETRFASLFAAGFARVSAAMGKGAFADKIDRTTRSIDNILIGGIPSAKVAFDALAADPTALDEVAAAYGFKLSLVDAHTTSPLQTAANLCTLSGEIAKAMQDGRLDHIEKLNIGGLARMAITQLEAMVNDADAIRIPK